MHQLQEGLARALWLQGGRVTMMYVLLPLRCAAARLWAGSRVYLVTCQ